MLSSLYFLIILKDSATSLSVQLWLEHIVSFLFSISNTKQSEPKRK